MTDELKPCPFCGEGVSFHRDSQTGGQQVGMANAGILCVHCGTTHFYGSDASHLKTCKRWNTRPIEDALRAEIAALNEVVRAADSMRAEALDPDYGCSEEVAVDAYDAARAKVTI